MRGASRGATGGAGSRGESGSRDEPRAASPAERRSRGRDAAAGRRRYWAARDEEDSALLWIDPAEVHHVRNVMRLGAGDRIELLDGSGCWFEAELDRPPRGDRWPARLITEHLAAPEPPLPWLIQALIRPARLEAAIDGATQIGVRGILLVQAARSAPQDALDAGRRARLERLLRMATAQSLGLRLPVLRGPIRAADLGRETAGFRLWVAHGPARSAGEGAAPRGLWSAAPGVPGSTEAAGTVAAGAEAAGAEAAGAEAAGAEALVIGPEGGFTEEEIAGFLAGGARLLDLGPRRLRAEIAALVGLAWLGARLRAGAGRTGPGPAV